MSNSLSYLTGLYGTTANATGSGSLLATFYGQRGQATNSSGLNPTTALALAERNMTHDVKTTAAQPMVKRDLDAFAAGVTRAKSVQQLLANPAVMKVLLTANGLGDQTATLSAPNRPLPKR